MISDCRFQTTMPEVSKSEISNLQSEIVLLAADDQAVDADRWAGHGAAKFEVAGDFGNVEEHFFQISRHRDLFHRIGQFAARDPEAGRAAGVVAGHQVRAVAEKFGDVQAFGNVGDDFLRSLRSRLQEIISRTDARSAGQSARGVARWSAGRVSSRCRCSAGTTSARRSRSPPCAASECLRRRTALVPKPPSMVPSSMTVTWSPAIFSPSLPARNDAPR